MTGQFTLAAVEEDEDEFPNGYRRVSDVEGVRKT